MQKVREWTGTVERDNLSLDDLEDDDLICIIVFDRPFNRWFIHVSSKKDFVKWDFDSQNDSVREEEMFEFYDDYCLRCNKRGQDEFVWHYIHGVYEGKWHILNDEEHYISEKIAQDYQTYLEGNFQPSKDAFKPEGKPNGQELYQDGISLQNERVKYWEMLGFKVIAGYVHDKSDLLIYDKKDKLLKVESFKAFKLDKQRRSGSHCRTITRDDLTPEIRDSINYHVPLFLTVQNILDKSKIISFQIDLAPSTIGLLRQSWR